MNTLSMNPDLLKKYNSRKKLMLVLSIVLDFVGVATYFIPGLGEGFDLGWAPIAGFVMYIMYGGYLGVFGGMFVFLEELIPFTDFIPGFLIMWVFKYIFFANRTQQQFIESNGQQILPQIETTVAKQLPING